MVKLFAAIAIGGIVYSLGHNSVFHGVLYSLVPMVEKARVPSMATIIWGVGAAVLAAFGADHFSLTASSLWAKRYVLGALVFGLLIYTMALGSMFVHKMSWEVDDRVGITALVGVLLAALLYAWQSGSVGGKQSLALLILLMLLELGNTSGYSFPHRSNKEMMSFMTKIVSNKDIAEYLHHQPGRFRVEVETEQLAINWGSYYNLDIIKAQLASITINVLNTEFHTWQTRLLFGVRYTVSEKPPLGDSRDVFTGASGLKVFENPSAFPRAWSVHNLAQIKDPAEGRALINDHLYDLHAKAFTLDKPAALQTCGGPDTVAVTKYAGEKLSIKAEMACQGMVVLSDTFFPGWKATLDGKPVQIYEVNLAMRGVVTPPGTHEIVMRYRPTSVYLGALFTVIGWLGALALVIFGPKSEIAQDFN